MTTNQVNYWANVERERSNRAQELETKRHNVNSEKISIFQSQEQKRHNLATEQLGSQDLSERIRHNIATEAEATRSNNLNYQAKIYAADSAAAASRYSADRSYSASVYSTNVSNATKRYDIDKQFQKAVEDRWSRESIAQSQLRNASQERVWKSQEAQKERSFKERENSRDRVLQAVTSGVHEVNSLVQTLIKSPVDILGSAVSSLRGSKSTKVPTRVTK